MCPTGFGRVLPPAYSFVFGRLSVNGCGQQYIFFCFAVDSAVFYLISGSTRNIASLLLCLPTQAARYHVIFFCCCFMSSVRTARTPCRYNTLLSLSHPVPLRAFDGTKHAFGGAMICSPPSLTMDHCRCTEAHKNRAKGPSGGAGSRSVVADREGLDHSHDNQSHDEVARWWPVWHAAIYVRKGDGRVHTTGTARAACQ